MAGKAKSCCESTAAERSASSAVNPDELAQLAWAVAHPARVKILSLLLARNQCMCGELVDALPLAQSTVSQHLKILKDCGLITGEVDGPKVCYCVNQAMFARLKALIAAL